MAARYSRVMPMRQSKLPLLWLLSDARNDAGLERALEDLPRGSGFVFRHYYLPSAERAVRFRELASIARPRDHMIIVSRGRGEGWDADGVYGSPDKISHGSGLRLATAHDSAELARAVAIGADGVFLSPVFATRSHPGGRTLGVHGFHVLAQQSPVPVIALGGMTIERARELDWPRWAAIDGLVSPQDS